MPIEYEFQKYQYSYPRLYDRLKILNNAMDNFIKNNKQTTTPKYNFWTLAYNSIGKSKKELMIIFNNYMKFMKNKEFKQTIDNDIEFLKENNLGNYPYNFKTNVVLHEVGHLLLFLNLLNWNLLNLKIVEEKMIRII